MVIINIHKSIFRIQDNQKIFQIYYGQCMETAGNVFLIPWFNSIVLNLNGFFHAYTV